MERFYKIIRKNFNGAIVIEPRNASWVSSEAVQIMREFKISKVFSDPERSHTEDYSYNEICYYRLHGSPEIYRSSYSEDFLISLAKITINAKKEKWIIFDNSMFGFATQNALKLKDNLNSLV